ncbi:hypothetical protein B0H13DRAFT_1910508 [Mycena leptocephala]|nr:hypothetical protein B0H13DRAFT_1910508 [Mycena leptocephala]
MEEVCGTRRGKRFAEGKWGKPCGEDRESRECEHIGGAVDNDYTTRRLLPRKIGAYVSQDTRACYFLTLRTPALASSPFAEIISSPVERALLAPPSSMGAHTPDVGLGRDPLREASRVEIQLAMGVVISRCSVRRSHLGVGIQRGMRAAGIHLYRLHISLTERPLLFFVTHRIRPIQCATRSYFHRVLRLRRATSEVRMASFRLGRMWTYIPLCILSPYE